jgi:hypothetical protein
MVWKPEGQDGNSDNSGTVEITGRFFNSTPKSSNSAQNPQIGEKNRGKQGRGKKSR